MIAALLCVASGALAQPIVFHGEAPADNFGWSVSPAGDVNGDSIPDIIIGAPSANIPDDFAGKAYLFLGPFDSKDIDAADAHAVVVAETFGDNLGGAVASAGDLNGDGFDDVLLGARGNDDIGIQAGRVYLFNGPFSGTLQATQADAIISGEEFDEVGSVLVGNFDLNADEMPDFAIGAPVGNLHGSAHVFFGPVAGNRSITDADVTVIAALPFEEVGRAVAVADVNMDGQDDLILGAPTFPLKQLLPGRVYVFFGPVSGTMIASQADAILEGTILNERFGISVAAGDVNADDINDLVIGADQFFGAGDGRAYVFHGPISPGFQPSTNADATFIATSTSDLDASNFGWQVAIPGDINADDVGDVLISDPFAIHQGEALSQGVVLAFHGPFEGEILSNQADDLLTRGPSDMFGQDVAAAGDLDGDGLGDFLIGGPDSTFSEDQPGVAVLVRPESCLADFDADGRLTILDFIAFQGAFQDGDASADVNADGELNILDFVAFQSLFTRGC